MNQQRTNPCVPRYDDGAIYRIVRHGRTQLDALRPTIHSQPARHHDGNWIGHIATNRAGRQLVRDRTSSHGVEATHPIFFIDHPKVLLAPLIWLFIARRLSHSSKACSPHSKSFNRRVAASGCGADSVKLMF
ncbi:MAG: hypothetical protein Q8L45_08275 [Xanthomonadaceae bacterium]|nr:hypothetical protein [Xanthomonadaceae bacterium]MDP2184026.1 hypothetical protein [Xanthomonadales bacterium]